MSLHGVLQDQERLYLGLYTVHIAVSPTIQKLQHWRNCFKPEHGVSDVYTETKSNGTHNAFHINILVERNFTNIKYKSQGKSSSLNEGRAIPRNVVVLKQGDDGQSPKFKK
jgi:hypothetical protein